MNKFLRTILKLLIFIVGIFIIYSYFLNRDINKIDSFCEEMKTGLDVNQIPVIAQKYNVGFKNIKDPNSIKNRSLGIKVEEKENTWFFAVAAPMTIGEHACSVYHDYKTVISASSGI